MRVVRPERPSRTAGACPGQSGGPGTERLGRVPPPEEGGLAVGGGAAVEIDSSGTSVCMSFFPRQMKRCEPLTTKMFRVRVKKWGAGQAVRPCSQRFKNDFMKYCTLRNFRGWKKGRAGGRRASSTALEAARAARRQRAHPGTGGGPRRQSKESAVSCGGNKAMSGPHNGRPQTLRQGMRAGLFKLQTECLKSHRQALVTTGAVGRTAGARKLA